MPQILGAKTGKLSITDALLIAGAKIVSERTLAPLIGNSSLFSGGIKMVGAITLHKVMPGKISDIVGTALTVDGAEDLLLAFMPNFSQGIFGDKQASSVELI
jgi:hypothetical protein